MTKHESFNQSGFSKFLNSLAGRILRLVAGLGFLVVGYMYRDHALGVISPGEKQARARNNILKIICFQVK